MNLSLGSNISDIEAAVPDYKEVDQVRTVSPARSAGPARKESTAGFGQSTPSTVLGTVNRRLGYITKAIGL